MLDSIYIGLTGLLGYSKDLSVIGNNVANVDTTGFKSSQLIFSDLFYRSQFGDGGGGAGAGVDNRLEFGTGLGTGATRQLFAQGELRQSGNDLDLGGRRQRLLRAAPRQAGGSTRAPANSRSMSTACSSPRRAGLARGRAGGRGRAARHQRHRPAHQRRQADREGELHRRAEFGHGGGCAGATGQRRRLRQRRCRAHARGCRLTNNASVTQGSWLVELREGADTVLGSGEIRFNPDGTPAVGFNTVKATLAPAGIVAERDRAELRRAGRDLGRAFDHRGGERMCDSTGRTAMRWAR